MKRRVFNRLAAMSLLFCVASFVLGIFGYLFCMSVGCKTAVGIGYRVYATRGAFVFVESRDLVLVLRQPGAGLFPTPPGHFGVNADCVPTSITPVFFFGTQGTGVLSAFLAELGFKTGGMQHAYRGGPIGGWNLPPTTVTDLLVSCRIPFWFSVLGFAILPAVWACPFIQRRRYLKATRRGFCALCGYDLRATPDRCPECGTERRSDARL